MRTTINVSDDLLKEARSVYKTDNKSEMIGKALEDAVRFRKLQQFMDLKGDIEFDEKAINKLRSAELDESENIN